MRWIKHGAIFTPDNNFDWMASHAAIPVVDRIDNGQLKIYFSTRDRQGRSHPTYLEVDESDPSKVNYIHDQPILPLGELGTFDDNGIMVSCLTQQGGVKYLYYMGWNPQVTVSYRLAIGLAISTDGGHTFEKYSTSPICDRDLIEPYFNTAPHVLVSGGQWKMWYSSCTGWKRINDWPEPAYNIKYAESQDGIHWTRSGHVCIDYDDFTEAIGRPFVYTQDGKYKMLYSFRSATNYRTDSAQGYRLGYAESLDGLNWTRMDDQVGIEISPDGWDSQMIEYCWRHEQGDATYLFYNGNGFGKSGFGYAKLAAHA